MQLASAQEEQIRRWLYDHFQELACHNGLDDDPEYQQNFLDWVVSYVEHHRDFLDLRDRIVHAASDRFGAGYNTLLNGLFDNVVDAIMVTTRPRTQQQTRASEAARTRARTRAELRRANLNDDESISPRANRHRSNRHVDQNEEACTSNNAPEGSRTVARNLRLRSHRHPSYDSLDNAPRNNPTTHSENEGTKAEGDPSGESAADESDVPEDTNTGPEEDQQTRGDAPVARNTDGTVVFNIPRARNVYISNQLINPLESNQPPRDGANRNNRLGFGSVVQNNTVNAERSRNNKAPRSVVQSQIPTQTPSSIQARQIRSNSPIPDLQSVSGNHQNGTQHNIGNGVTPHISIRPILEHSGNAGQLGPNDRRDSTPHHRESGLVDTVEETGSDNSHVVPVHTQPRPTQHGPHALRPNYVPYDHWLLLEEMRTLAAKIKRYQDYFEQKANLKRQKLEGMGERKCNTLHTGTRDIGANSSSENEHNEPQNRSRGNSTGEAPGYSNQLIQPDLPNVRSTARTSNHKDLPQSRPRAPRPHTVDPVEIQNYPHRVRIRCSPAFTHAETQQVVEHIRRLEAEPFLVQIVVWDQDVGSVDTAETQNTSNQLDVSNDEPVLDVIVGFRTENTARSLEQKLDGKQVPNLGVVKANMI